jgi:hypothetical protein
MANLGRTPLINPAIVAEIVTMIQAGNTYEIAAQAAGIDGSTFYKWQKRGRDAKRTLAQGGEIGEIEYPYVEFVEAIKKARAMAIATAVVHVRRAMPKNWVAAMTFLERSDPEHWGRRDRLDVKATGAFGLIPMTKEDALALKDNLHRFFPALGEPRRIQAEVGDGGEDKGDGGGQGGA